MRPRYEPKLEQGKRANLIRLSRLTANMARPAPEPFRLMEACLTRGKCIIYISSSQDSGSRDNAYSVFK